MRGSNDHSTGETGGEGGARARDAAVWALVRRQHGVVARRQLLELGLGARRIERRIAAGRLHPVWRGVYAVGRPQLSRHGRWMAAVLAGGPAAVLSHGSAAALWGFGKERGVVEISVPAERCVRRPGIRAHRRAALGSEGPAEHEGIPVTSPTLTLIDEATHLNTLRLERCVNEADKLERVRADVLHASLDRYRGQPGVASLRALLDPLTFRLSDSDLEVFMRRLARAAGLRAVPKKRTCVNGYRVDFYWPDLGIVVEADGLRYHRTPSQQKKGLERDQIHMASGMWPLRFSHWQVRYERRYVREILRKTVRRAKAAKTGVG